MSTPNIQTQNAFLDLRNWQQNNQKLDEMELSIIDMEKQMDAEYVAAGGTKEAEKSIFEKYGEEYDKKNQQFLELAVHTPLDYNLMENVGDKTYEQVISEIAQGEISYKDKNNDGALSFEEYALSELADLGENLTRDEILNALIDTYFVFDSMETQQYNKERDGLLSQEELEAFYKNVDGFMSINGPVFQDIIKNEDGTIDTGFVEYLCQYQQGMVYDVVKGEVKAYGHQSNEYDGIVSVYDFSDYIEAEKLRGYYQNGEPDKDSILGAYKAYLTQEK